jgi:hypothetical protein
MFEEIIVVYPFPIKLTLQDITSEPPLDAPRIQDSPNVVNDRSVGSSFRIGLSGTVMRIADTLKAEACDLPRLLKAVTLAYTGSPQLS